MPRHEQHLAAIGDTVLDVEAAFRLLRAKPRHTVRIDVESWARLYGLDGNPHSPICVGPLFDPAHAMTTDLRRPLILVTITTGDGHEIELIADGSHRLARAFAECRDSLPAWTLSASETEAITVTHPTWKNRTLTTDSAALVSAISATLTSEHWTRAQVLIPSPDASATAFTGPDRTARLVITHVPGEPLVAGLTGHPAGHPSTTLWSLTITDPTKTQLLAAARAGANDRLRHVVALADRLQKAGWEMEIDDKPSGIMCQIASTHGRTLTRLDGTADTPGGWIIDGEGMYADATDGIPTAVLAALATTPRREPAPHATLNAADRPEPTRKSDA